MSKSKDMGNTEKQELWGEGGWDPHSGGFGFSWELWGAAATKASWLAWNVPMGSCAGPGSCSQFSPDVSTARIRDQLQQGDPLAFLEQQPPSVTLPHHLSLQSSAFPLAGIPELPCLFMSCVLYCSNHSSQDNRMNE